MAALARAEILRPEPPPGLRAPARARRRLPRACRSASASCCTPAPPASCARPARRWTRSRGQLMHTPRRGDAEVARLLHEAGSAAIARGAIDNARRLPAARARGAAAGRGARRSCCSTSARSRRSPAGREAAAAPARGLRRGSTDVRTCASAPPTRSAARCCSRPRRPRAPRWRARPRAALPPELADEALGLRGVRADGRAVRRARSGRDADRDESRTAARRRGRRARRRWRAIAALDWTHERRPRRRRASRSSLAALAGGELLERDPNLLTLAAMLPMIVGDRDEALHDLRPRDAADAHRRGSLFAITGMYLWRGFTLFWRGDLIDAEEELRAARSTRPRPGATAPDTLQWNAAHLCAGA